MAWRAETEAMRGRVVEEDTLALEDVRLVGGMDLSFVPGDPNTAVACLAVCAFLGGAPVHVECRVVPLVARYVPGRRQERKMEQEKQEFSRADSGEKTSSTALKKGE